MPYTKVLGLDIDSTLWEFSDPFYAEANRLKEEAGLPGPEWRREDQVTWNFQDNMPKWIISKSFEHVFDPSTITSRPLYPYCAKALQWVHEKLGVHYVYVTHNMYPERVETALAEWMHMHLDKDFPLHVLKPWEDKIEVLREYDAFGLIDDKPDTIEASVKAGFWTATKRQPYNREVLNRYPEVARFDSWAQVPRLVHLGLHNRMKIGA